MKQSVLLPAAMALAAVAWIPFDSAQEPGRGQEPARRQEPGAERGEHAEHGEEGPLHDAMESLNRGMRSLRRSVGDPEKAAENLELLRGMQKSALEALPLCPEPFQPLSDLEQRAWRIGYERKILAVADGLLQLELAIAEGRFDAAKEIYSHLGGLKKEGHDTYVPEEEEE